MPVVWIRGGGGGEGGGGAVTLPPYHTWIMMRKNFSTEELTSFIGKRGGEMEQKGGKDKVKRQTF